MAAPEAQEPTDRTPSSSERPLVDVTLIDAALALSVKQRLEQNDQAIRTIALLRDAVARATTTGSPPNGQPR